MATSITTAFIKQFESEVHMAYQRMGSKLKNTISVGDRECVETWAQSDDVVTAWRITFVTDSNWKSNI